MVEAREELGPERRQAHGAAPCPREAPRPAQGRAQQAHRRSGPLPAAVRRGSAGRRDAPGQHQPEILIEASKQEKVHSFRKDGAPTVVIERMTYAEAHALIMRARELVAPFIHGKKPVQIDLNIRGVDVIEEAPRQITAPGDRGRVRRRRIRPATRRRARASESSSRSTRHRQRRPPAQFAGPDLRRVPALARSSR
jgi:hypothetical protein